MLKMLPMNQIIIDYSVLFIFIFSDMQASQVEFEMCAHVFNSFLLVLF